DRELAVVLACWARATAGRGQVLIVCGEAGIGKSRIVAEGCAMIRSLDPASEAADERPLVFQCAPYHANSALYPVVRLLAALAGIDRADPDRIRRDKLDRLIGAKMARPEQTRALIAELLGSKANQPDAPATGASREKRERTIDALVDWCASRQSDRTQVIL